MKYYLHIQSEVNKLFDTKNIFEKNYTALQKY